MFTNDETLGETNDVIKTNMSNATMRKYIKSKIIKC
jgi:hypothetical protein